MRPTADIRRHLLLQRLYEHVLRLGDQRTTSMSNNGEDNLCRGWHLRSVRY
jgi:hypothetical protein